jgi:hypothetical protein
MSSFFFFFCKAEQSYIETTEKTGVSKKILQEKSSGSCQMA